MSARRRVGIVEILKARTYPLTTDQDASLLDTPTALIEPGEYPVYREGGRYYWEMTGHVNGRGIENLGDGMFLMNRADVATDEEVTVTSHWFDPLEWDEFLADPQTLTRFSFTLKG
jgi:hypothetical protein